MTQGKVLTARQRSDLIASLNAGADALDQVWANNNLLGDHPGKARAEAQARRLRRYARELEKDQKQAEKARSL